MAELDDLFGSDDEIAGGDEQISLAVRPESSGVLSFHNGTEEALYHFVKAKAGRGDANSILKAIDDFCYSQHWMMHVGDSKLPLLDLAIQKTEINFPDESLCVVELGAYCGYSAIYLATKLRPDRGDHLYSIEINAKCVMWTRRMLEYAGLSDVVTVVESSAAGVDSWRPLLHKDHINLLFVDHDKAQYLNDLNRLEQANLLRSGTVVVADNVLSFNVPLQAYLDHVRDPAGLYASSELHSGFIEYASARGAVLDPEQSPGLVDGLEISVFR